MSQCDFDKVLTVLRDEEGDLLHQSGDGEGD